MRAYQDARAKQAAGQQETPAAGASDSGALGQLEGELHHLEQGLGGSNGGSGTGTDVALSALQPAGQTPTVSPLAAGGACILSVVLMLGLYFYRQTRPRPMSPPLLG